MFNPIKAYQHSQDVQRNWIRKHPVQYVAVNAICIALTCAYFAHKNRQEERRLDEMFPVTPQTEN